MFGGSGTNPYDDLVNKATDENLTSENWEIILNLCDKVQDEGEQGYGTSPRVKSGNQLYAGHAMSLPLS